eukprot:9488204-Pyramimonas_sp.AAC.1
MAASSESLPSESSLSRFLPAEFRQANNELHSGKFVVYVKRSDAHTSVKAAPPTGYSAACDM